MILDFSHPTKRSLKVFRPYTGMGKSFAAAEHLARIAECPKDDAGRPFVRTTYAAPSHRVASDMERSLVQLGVPEGDFVHRWSVLVPRTNLDGSTTPPCLRREELEPLIEAGTGLQVRKVCVSCPLREQCPALAAALADDAKAKTAAIEILTHAALGGEVTEQPLICDEPPGYLESVFVPSDVLACIRSSAPIRGALSVEREAARYVAAAWLRGTSYENQPVGIERDDEEGNPIAREHLGPWLRHRDGGAFDVVNGQDLPTGDLATLRLLRGVRDVLRVASWDQKTGTTRKKVKELECSIPTAAIVRLREQGGILLDGTPWVAALESLFDRVELSPEETPDWDRLPVSREWRKSNACSKTRLCHSYWSSDTRRFEEEKRCRSDGDVPVPGINWPLIENELRLSLATADGPLLLGSFKCVVDVIHGTVRDHVERDVLDEHEVPRLASLLRVREMLRGGALCSFGAVRSRNDWQHVRQVLVVGTPYMNARQTAEALGMSEEEAKIAMHAYARGELIQTAERGRSVRRTAEQPLTLTLVCAASCLPEGWGASVSYASGGRVAPLAASERRSRAQTWFDIALQVRGESCVRDALGVTSLKNRQWSNWKRADKTDLSEYDGVLCELTDGGSAAVPSYASVETQTRWRGLLDSLRGMKVPSEWRAKFNQYRTRGREWSIGEAMGAALEQLTLPVVGEHHDTHNTGSLTAILPIRRSEAPIGDVAVSDPVPTPDVLDTPDGRLLAPRKDDQPTDPEEPDVTKTELKKRMRALANAAPLNTPLDETARQTLDEVLPGHPDWDVKRGAGVKHYEVRLTQYGTRGFYIVRQDGSETDISWMQAIAPSSRKTDVLRALRALVANQTTEFRRTHQLPSDWHVDHVIPLDRLAAEFLKAVNLTWETVPTKSTADDALGDVITDPALATLWQKWHGIKAKLQGLPASENMRKGNR